MSRGKNPYLSAVELRVPARRYSITVSPENQVIEVDPTDLPDGGIGLPGSILAALLRAGVGLDHACGGVCACSTCHVYVRKGLASCGEASEEEEDMLDSAPALAATSRLACQAIPDGSMDLVVEIPEWNRNAVKEGH